VAKLLGYSHVTIWRKIKAGEIPYRRNGANGAYRVPKWWLDQELEAVRAQVLRRPPPIVRKNGRDS
jgi:predicted DNA-binding transcriptional regulator AlpA